MADSKISALSDGSPLASTDMFVIARAGVSYRIPASQLGSTDGWIDDTAETWTYASGSGGGPASFTIAGIDLTAKYTPGTRIKLTQTTAKFFVVTSSTFSTNTTVNITGGIDYTLANAAISLNYHSYQQNPQGYPGWFRYTPTIVGATSVSTSCQFAVSGRVCFFGFGIQGTSNSVNKTCTLPVNYGGLFTEANPIRQACSGKDNGALMTSPARVDFNVSGATTMTLYKDYGGNVWTASGAWYCYGLVTYNI
jgi:hypothetical protein